MTSQFCFAVKISGTMQIEIGATNWTLLFVLRKQRFVIYASQTTQSLTLALFMPVFQNILQFAIANFSNAKLLVSANGFCGCKATPCCKPLPNMNRFIKTEKGLLTMCKARKATFINVARPSKLTNIRW
jgi:hypothetical protein